MRFTLISDVHVDSNKWDWNLLQDCDPTIPMVVAGDISNDVMETSLWIKQLRHMFPKVIWVAGNHDFYNLGFHHTRVYNAAWEAQWPYPRNVAEIYDHYTRWCEAHDVHFLHRSSVVVHGVQFVGVTGWHNFDAAPYLSLNDQTQAWQDHMMDSRYINWGVNTINDWKPVLQAALADADYLRAAVTQNDMPKVILSHHIPHRNLVKVTTNHMWNLLNGSFLNTELETVRHSSVKAWCYGHTHFRDDRVIDDIRHVNNARGYPRENLSWQPVEIEVII
jgi:hypothetical protein